MKKYGALLIVLIIIIGFMIIFNSIIKSSSYVEGKEVFVPILTVGETTIETKIQTICWGVDDCRNVLDGYDIVQMTPRNYVVQPGELLEIKFTEKPLPNTIILRVDELSDYREQWQYTARDNSPLFNYFLMVRSKPSYIDLPNEQGTYTFNMLVYWNVDKAATQGLVNYRFRITVE